MYDAYDPHAITPPLSGLNAPGNALTAVGPTQEPFGVGSAPMDPMKKQMMMALMAQQMGKMGQAAPRASMTPRQSFDIYGNPV
jgi:hypothetical protein